VIHALLDTSAVIGSADGLKLDPENTAAISVVTVSELHSGSRLAADPQLRAARQARLAAIRAAFEPIPVDEEIATYYG
jgi:predicted nucleic acid-binding protein